MINIRHLSMLFFSALLAAFSLGAITTEAADHAPEIGDLTSVEIRDRSRPYGISVASILQRRSQRQKLFLVDIRNRESYDTIRIPGSINLALDAVKVKAFLKTQPVVLIHEGYGYRRMAQTCRHLEGLGFDIRILYGGLNAWEAHGGPLEGDRFARTRLNRMPPQAFYLEKDSINWMVVDSSTVPDAESRILIPSAVRIAILKDPESGFKRLRDAAEKRGCHQFLSILIFNETGLDYDRLEKMIPEDDDYTVFFLSGGLRGYRRFLQHRRLSLKPRESRIKTVSKCRPCGQNIRQPEDR